MDFFSEVIFVSYFSDRDSKDFGICPFLEATATKLTVAVLQRTLEYKKCELLYVYHASLSVIFALSALTRAMFVIAILGSDRSCPFMQEDKMWLFCHTGYPSPPLSQPLK